MLFYLIIPNKASKYVIGFTEKANKESKANTD